MSRTKNLEQVIDSSERKHLFSKEGLLNSTALLTISHPVSVGLQTILSGVSDLSCFANRAQLTLLTYLGLGEAYRRGMYKSRKLFNINEKSPKRELRIHDSAYSFVFNLVLTPALLIASGEFNPKKIASAIFLQSVLGLAFSGEKTGYMLDTFGDLARGRLSYRLPEWVNNQTSSVKQKLAVGTVIGSYALSLIILAFPNGSYFIDLLNRGNRDYQVQTQNNLIEDNEANNRYMVANKNSTQVVQSGK